MTFHSVTKTGDSGRSVQRLVETVALLRKECPWDAKQTHLSLVKHLIEECAELVDALETGSSSDQREELGDVLLQVIFHAQIAAETDQFTLGDVADEITEKLVARHPYVFADDDIPDNLDASWEQRKRAAKHRSSVLDGIAESLPTLAKAAKIAQRMHDGGPGLGAENDEVELVNSEQAGEKILTIVRQAQLSGIDIDQATRDAIRRWKEEIYADEQGK